MDKQKKQLLILVGLVVVAAGVGFLMKDRIFGPPAPEKKIAASDPNTVPVSAPGPTAPAGGPAGKPNAAPPLKPGEASSTIDLPTPDLKVPDLVIRSVEPNAFDPLKVLNTDVVLDKIAKEIKELKEKWKLSGIVRAGTEKVTTERVKFDDKGEAVRDAEGKWVMETVVENREIWAVFFEGNPRSYREGDRLTNTYFKVEKIVFVPEGAYIEVISDNGAKVKLSMSSEDRYGPTKGK